MDATTFKIIDHAIKNGLPILGTLLGAIGGFLSSHLLEKARSARKWKEERLRLQHEALVKPVIQFVDDLAVLISQVYWNHTDREVADIHDKICAVRERECMVEARVEALRNPTLRAKFNEFTQQLYLIQRNLDSANQDLTKARERTHAASQLAGDIFKIIFIEDGYAAIS